MDTNCIIVYVGYAFLFILLLIMTKLYSKQSNENFKLHKLNMDLLFTLEVMERLNKYEDKKDQQ